MSGKTWFSRTFGFLEHESYEVNRRNFHFDFESNVLTSLANGKKFYVGPFECPSVAQLQQTLNGIEQPRDLGGLVFKELVGDVRALHLDPKNNGAVFMVASQFNALEMVGPGVTPEKGITNYIKDQTQGPACALVCPAATVFRNYMVNGTGQGGGRQLNLLADVEALLGVRYWNMINGYCMPVTGTSMAELGRRMTTEEGLAERMRASMRVAIHWETQVGSDGIPGAEPASSAAAAAAAAPGAAASAPQAAQRGGGGGGGGSAPPPQRVCQVFCSAVPVTYCHMTRNRGDWEPLAAAALAAAYEATLAAAAALAARRRARVRVFLTRLGGGAFGNSAAWIGPAIDAACRRHAAAPLDVFLVKFGSAPR